jgi:hypothetical protein
VTNFRRKSCDSHKVNSSLPIDFFSIVRYWTHNHFLYQSLVDLVVIDAAFGMENHGSIPCNCGREGAGTTWCKIWLPNQIKLVVKAKKEKVKFFYHLDEFIFG